MSDRDKQRLIYLLKLLTPGEIHKVIVYAQTLLDIRLECDKEEREED